MVKSSFFNPNGPCPFFDSDGKVCYIICSKYKCSTREKEQTDKRAIDNDKVMDDDCYYFLGYDPAVLAQHLPDVLDMLGCVLT